MGCRLITLFGDNCAAAMKIRTKTVIRCLTYPGLIIFAVYLILPIVTGPNRGPSFETQRKWQRKTVEERVQSAGGWAAVRRDCETLVANSPHSYFFWFPPRTNAHVTEYSNSVPFRSYVTNIDYGHLPTALATLQPREIESDTITNGPAIVRIKLFGMRRTGMRDIPYYGLWVVCGGSSHDYVPRLTGGPGRAIKKVADGIFEVHQ
jgi:hypothetical protein